MGLPRLADRTRKRLVELVADSRRDGREVLAELERIRGDSGEPAFAGALGLLVQWEHGDEDAERLLRLVIEHRSVISRRLGRDPGLRVALVDWLTNVEPRLERPKIVELDDFERTSRSADTDPLTRLHNRRVLRRALDRELRRGRRHGLFLSLVLFDLDRFKAVNDSFGHCVGDRVLQRVASIVRRSVRDSDLACRYGGEEIALLLPETERLGAYAVAERVRERVRDTFRGRETAGHEVRVTLSAGVATFPEDASDAATLVERADAALYTAKRAGRDRVSLHFAERRRHVRFPAEASVRAVVEGERGEPGRAAPLNLSRSGVLLQLDTRPAPRGPVRVRLRREGSPERSADGHVVREVDGEGETVRVGIAFDELMPESALRSHVALAMLGRRGTA